MERGYRAYVDVYDDTFYVDTNTGEGFDKILAKIDPLLNKYASTMYIPGFKFEDAKSELSIIAIEGIKAFDPHRDVKLSTFLHKHIHNKKISFLRSENKMSNDAFALQAKDEGTAKIKRIREEINFSQFQANKSQGQGEADSVLFENTIAEEGTPGSDSAVFKTRYDKSEFESSIKKICAKLDYKTRKIIELVYFKDYSIKDAADEVGLSGWAASMRLKKLANKRSFRTIFGVDDGTEKFGNEESEPEYLDVERGQG
jgi:RNA polymerase sigma factor (sigma-70 family)